MQKINGLRNPDIYHVHISVWKGTKNLPFRDRRTSIHIEKDPKGIWKEAFAKGGATAAENAIRDAGYKGYFHNGVAASFEKVPVTTTGRSQIAAHEANGGSTFTPEGKNMNGSGKYSVGSYPERTQHVDTLTPEALQAFKDKNADVLSKPDHAVGTWKDPDTGKADLDVARLYDNREEAIAAGKAANQKAIYHLGDEGVIPTGGTGEGPLPADLASKEIATRRPTTKTGDMTNNPDNLSGMDAVAAADKASPSRTSQGGKPILGHNEKLATALANYSDSPVKLTAKELHSPMAIMEKHIQHYADNLRALYHAIPEAIRGPAKQWYVTAHNLTKAMAEKYGIAHEQAAAVVAALSPKNPWDNNAGVADRLIDAWKNKKGHEWSPEMDKSASNIRATALKAKNPSKTFVKLIDDVRGKTYDELVAKKTPKNATPEQIKDSADALRGKQALWLRLVDEAHGAKDLPLYSPDGTIRGSVTRTWSEIDPAAKALDILENGDIQHIHDVMGQGHKIRNFYNNIINPWSERGHVTIDTHAVGAAHMKPMSQDDIEVMHNFGNSATGVPGASSEGSTGIAGSYPIYEEAYRRVAKELGIQPRELQSITWEGIKSLMGDEKKTPELREAVQNIWDEHKAGKISIDDARTKIIDAAGGFSKPDWMPQADWDKSQNQGEEFPTE